MDLPPLTSDFPPWLRPHGGLTLFPVGQWWDLVALPEEQGLDLVLQLSRRRGGLRPGPVVRDALPAVPRIYLLVPCGTSRWWRVPGTRALGLGSYVVVPGHRRCRPPGPYWEVLPDPECRSRLVDAEMLHQAVTGRRSL